MVATTARPAPSRPQARPVPRSFEDRWQDGLAALDAFTAREGHALVPSTWMEGDFRLGQWATATRHRRPRLPASHRADLDSRPEWSWGPQMEKWRANLAALDAFIHREGHAKVPQPHIENGRKLGAWVYAQKRGSNAILRAELDTRPAWRSASKSSLWEKNMNALDAYILREGHTYVTARLDPQLSAWVDGRRAAAGSLPAARRADLEARPEWDWTRDAARWRMKLTVLDTFVQREGHANVPWKHQENDHSLGHWAAKWRKAGRTGRLSEAQRADLSARPGWSWARIGPPNPVSRSTGARDASSARRWAAGLAALDAYIARTGHANVDSRHHEGNIELGGWVARRRAQEASMPAAHRAELNSRPEWAWVRGIPGWQADRWNAGLQALDVFAAREGHADISSHWVEGDCNLGAWVSRQRKNAANLSPEQHEKLSARPEWSWGPRKIGRRARATIGAAARETQ